VIYQIFPERFDGGRGLEGIVRRLDHVARVSAEALYLTPIVDAPSDHRYDARSFERVDPRLGGDAAFELLAAECRRRGLGVILDLVVNHTGKEHPWFAAACADPQSVERRFYTFDASGKHHAWRGHGHLPELRLEEPELRRRLWEAPDSVVRSWLRRGASGWRLDCANDLGIEVCRAIRNAAREEDAPLGVTGELLSWAEPFLREGALDGVMNYLFREAVVAALRGELTGDQAARELATVANAYPLEALLRSWNILGTHDTPRVRTLLGAREPVLLAFLLAFTYPGVPLVYYGDEVGLEGGEDPDNRRPMIWDEARWDTVVLERVRELAKLRRSLVALRTGAYLPLAASASSVIAFSRITSEIRETVLVVANVSDRAVTTRVSVKRAEFVDALPLVDRAGSGGTVKMRSGSFTLALEPFTAAVLVPEPVEPSGYDFWKRAASG
jgi:alpha-glucosidase